MIEFNGDKFIVFSTLLFLSRDKRVKRNHICLLAMTEEKSFQCAWKSIYFWTWLVNKYKCSFRFVCSTFIQFVFVFLHFLLHLYRYVLTSTRFSVFHHNAIHRKNLFDRFYFSWIMRLLLIDFIYSIERKRKKKNWNILQFSRISHVLDIKWLKIVVDEFQMWAFQQSEHLLAVYLINFAWQWNKPYILYIFFFSRIQIDMYHLHWLHMFKLFYYRHIVVIMIFSCLQLLVDSFFPFTYSHTYIDLISFWIDVIIIHLYALS